MERRYDARRPPWRAKKSKKKQTKKIGGAVVSYTRYVSAKLSVIEILIDLGLRSFNRPLWKKRKECIFTSAGKWRRPPNEKPCMKVSSREWGNGDDLRMIRWCEDRWVGDNRSNWTTRAVSETPHNLFWKQYWNLKRCGVLNLVNHMLRQLKKRLIFCHH